jgi:hypothetical protein
VEPARAVKEAAGRSRMGFCYPVVKRREAVENPRELLEKLEVDRGRRNTINSIRINDLNWK